MITTTNDFDLTNLTNYSIIELIATGGMGDVYLAKDKRLNRIVAIKKIKKNASGNTCPIMLKEAQILAQLNHPNIVQIFDIIKENHQILLVMEYVNGKTLQQIIKESRPSLTQILSWLYDVLKGLIIAHKKGIVHCDIKPSNIIIGENNQAKITDFGVAHLEFEGNTNPFSYASQAFMSPEQATRDALDFKSDLFSFGVLAYVLISGNDLSQLKTSCFQQEIKVSDFIPKLPEELVFLIEQLLRTNKIDRPDSAKIVAYKIKQILISLEQQEALEQDTIDLSKSNHHFKTRKEILSSLKWLNISAVTTALLITALMVIIINIYTSKGLNPEPEIRQIVVLRPSLSSDSKISNLQGNLIVASVDNAIREMVINTKNMRLISRKEVEPISNDLEKIGLTTGASEIINSMIDCNNLQCNITFSRLKGDGWPVIAQKQWPIPFRNFSEINSSIQLNFSLIYPQSKNPFLKGFKSSDSDFEEYIRLYSRIQFDGYDSKDEISELISLLTRSPYFYSAYGLFREVLLNKYEETRDTKYLTQLKKTLNSAPNEYKESAFYYTDNFWLSVNNSDYIQAKKMIGKLKTLGADSSTIYELTAKLFLNSNKIDKAIENYKKAISLRPSTTLLYNLSLCYWWSGDTKKSREIALQLLQITPEDYSTKQLLASLSLSQGDLSTAITIYEKIINLNPKSIDLNNLAIAYSLGKNYTQALELAKKAVSQAPNNPTWLLNLADIEAIIGNKELSREYYRKTIQLNSQRDDLKSWLEKAQAYVHLGKKESALRSLNKAKKISINNSEVTFTAALIYTLLKEETSAVLHVEESLKNNVGAIWFNLPWFNSLCSNKKFVKALTRKGNSNRCSNINWELD